MAGNKNFKQLEKKLSKYGFEYAYTSGLGWVYEHAELGEVTVNTGLNEGTARNLLRNIEKRLGKTAKKPKRNASAVKARQASDRERLRAESERLRRERESILTSRQGATLSRELANRVTEIERERRQIEQLMAAPTLNNATNHTAGSR